MLKGDCRLPDLSTSWNESSAHDQTPPLPPANCPDAHPSIMLGCPAVLPRSAAACNTYLYYRVSSVALTVRLSAKTERAVNALARRRGQTRSDVVREAIERYTALSDEDPREDRPYHRWADVVGIVRIGRRDPDRTTGEQFTDLVIRKSRARRSR